MGKEHAATMLIISLQLCCLFIISSSQSLNSPTDDESTLLSIKSFITSDMNNKLTSNWSRGTSFCTWTGITCSPMHRRVTALNLSNFELTGLISPSIVNLSNLGTLDLSRNSFEGTIPSELGSLSRLTYLSLEFNNFNGEIPLSIFNLTRLQILSLTKNRLSGTIPPSIDTMLPNLQRLSIGMNRFSGEIPNTISNLSHLTVFDILNNSFTGHIPTNLGNLHHLEDLRLALNCFTNNLSIPEQEFLTSLANCRNLTIIAIHNNPVTGALPKSIGNLSASLNYFLAKNCKFKGVIPSEIGNLQGLTWLHLEVTDLTGDIPTSLGSLRRLQRLILSGNFLHGSLPESICSMENMYYADFSFNKLSGELPACLGNIRSLRHLYLDNNLFSSRIPPTLFNNTRILSLSLSMNNFDGSLPSEFGNLNSLETINVSWNRLSGNIPITINKLQNLATLDLHNNMFNGSIPLSLGDQDALQYLDLSQNSFSGSIPMSFENLVYLDYFNVSFNDLSGEIPGGGRFLNFTSELFMGNRGLCGPSRFGVLACPSIRRAPGNTRRLLIYVLPSIASVIVVAIFVIVLINSCARNATPSPETGSPLGITPERISYYEILRATSNLDPVNLIGQGGIGSVYKGIFTNGMAVAVKVFNLEVQDAFKSFDIECQIMRRLRHRNLVKIITSCSNLDFKALVMEYMPNGNLDKWLHSPDCELNFDQRLQIMTDVAHAMEYLHHGYSSPVAHCDLKPRNIILDEDMVARVGDFGISKLLMEDQRIEQTKTLGTIGYMAPEYGSSGLVSTTADIYSYGIMLLETFSGKRPTDELFSGEFTMSSWASECFLQSKTMQIIDAKLLNANENCVGSKIEECMKSIIELGIQCSADFPEKRPNIRDVLFRLKKIQF